MGKEVQENGKSKNQLQQEEYQKMLDEGAGLAGPFKKVYGVKPQLFQAFPKNEKETIENMTVELPEGISEEDFMAVVMGAMSADERMHGVLSGSSSDGHLYRFNHIYMVDNVLVSDVGSGAAEGARMKGFEKVMADARQKAVEAVEAYKNGDKSLVQQYQQHFLDGAKTLAELPVGSEKRVEKKEEYVFQLAGKFIDKDEFREKNQDAASVNLRNYCHAHQIAEENIKRKQQMLGNIPPKGSKERENQLLDVVLSGYIVGRNKIRREKELGEQMKIVQEEFVKLGHKKNSNFFELNGRVFGAYMADKSMINQVTGVDLILQGENGYDKIKEMYGESIKKTELFQMLMNAEDAELGESLETVNMMLEMKKASFEDFTEVPVSQQFQEKAAEMSKSGMEENRKMLQEHMEGLQEISKEYLRHEKYADEEVSADAKPEGVRAQLDRIDDLLGRLEGADPAWRKVFAGNQDKFAAVKESLTKLNRFAKNMSVEPGSNDINEYIQLSKEAEKAAEDYLTYKKTNHKDSSYEKNRIAAVDAVHDALMYKRRSLANWNLSSVKSQAGDEKEEINADIKMTLYNDDRVAKAKENAQKYAEVNQKIKTTAATADNVKAVYYGGDYKKIDRHSYSATRSAVVSIAVMAMAATGKYSMEELADPAKLSEEKRKMGEEVVRHIEGATHDDQKWIAGNIIEGQKKMLGMVNEFCRQHDVLSPDFAVSPDYITMKFAQETVFDTFQELKHCLPEGDEYLRENYPNEPVQSADQFRNDIQDKVRPIAEMMNGIQKVAGGVENYLQTGQFKEEIIQAGMQVKIMRDTLLEKRKQQPDTDLTELLTPAEVEATALKSLVVFSGAGAGLAKELKSNDKTKDGVRLADAFIDKIADGSLYQDMKVDETGMKVENAPTIDKLKADFRYEGFKDNMESLNIVRGKIQEKVASLEKKVAGNKAAGEIYSKCLSSFSKVEMVIKRSMSDMEVGDYKKITKQYFKEKMALELCAKSPSSFKNSSMEEILNGVEQFKGYQELAAKVDNVGIPEIMELWDSDVTQNIIDRTIDEQKAELDKQNVTEKNANRNLEKDTSALKNEQIIQMNI